MSSSSEQIFNTFTSISVTFSPTNGNDQVNTSMKFGSQYGCGEQLNCRMFITLFSYLSTAACKIEGKEKQFRLKSGDYQPQLIPRIIRQEPQRNHLAVSSCLLLCLSRTFTQRPSLRSPANRTLSYYLAHYTHFAGGYLKDKDDKDGSLNDIFIKPVYQ